MEGAFTGVNEVNSIASATNLFPNPATNAAYFVVNLSKSTPIDFEIKNTSGETVLSKNIGVINEGQNKLNIDTRNLSSGMYFVSIKAADGLVTKKLIIER